MLIHYVFLALGGALGSILRYVFAIVLEGVSGKFPLATFAVNFIGCLFIGVFFALAERTPGLNPVYKIFLVSGFLGGFTTFSSFGWEAFSLLKSGHFIFACGYVCGSVLVAFLATAVGYYATLRYC